MVPTGYIYGTKPVMQETSTADYDIHAPVDYDDSRHLYSYRGRRYTSATQLLDQFIPPFDVEERSVYMAHRYGHTPQYWKDKWRTGNRQSLDRGDRIHDREEQSLYQRRFIDYNPEPLPVHTLSTWSRLYNDPLINLPNGVYPEMKLWRHDHMIAGRSDKVILQTVHRTQFMPNLRSPIRVADIEDYKTNRKIQKFGWQSHEGGPTRKMLAPLDHIEDAEFWHYALQLSLYQYMLEWHGFYPGTRRLIHFPHPTDEFPDPKPVPYELPYLRQEAVLMIHHRNKQYHECA